MEIGNAPIELHNVILFTEHQSLSDIPRTSQSITTAVTRVTVILGEHLRRLWWLSSGLWLQPNLTIDKHYSTFENANRVVHQYDLRFELRLRSAALNVTRYAYLPKRHPMI